MDGRPCIHRGLTRGDDDRVRAGLGVRDSRRQRGSARWSIPAGSRPARRRGAHRRLLVVVETALAIILLTGAGLVLRSFSRLLAVDPGFTDRSRADARHRAAGRIAIAKCRRAKRSTRARSTACAHRRGSRRSARAAVTPLTGNNWTVPFDRAERPVPAGQRPPDVGWQAASGGYFSALQNPARAGRLFDAATAPTATPRGDRQRGDAGALLPGRERRRPASVRSATIASAKSSASSATSPRGAHRQAAGRHVFPGRAVAVDGDHAVHPHRRRSAPAIGRGADGTAFASTADRAAGHPGRWTRSRGSPCSHAARAVAARRVRAVGARACRGRDLRRDVVLGATADARNRHAHGARRHAPATSCGW